VVPDLHALDLGCPLLEFVAGLDDLLRGVVLVDPSDRQQVDEHLRAPSRVDLRLLDVVELGDHFGEERHRLIEHVVLHHELGPVIHDLGQLFVVLLFDVLRVDVVGAQHLLLLIRVIGFGECRFGVDLRVLVGLGLLDLAGVVDADTLAVELAGLLLAASLVVLEVVLHRQHLRERSVARVLALGIELEHPDELVVGLLEVVEALLPLVLVLGVVVVAGQRPEQLGVVVLQLVAVLVVREGLDERHVRLFGELVGAIELGLLGFVVPDRRHLLHGREGVVLAGLLDRFLEVALVELRPVVTEDLGLLPLDFLVVGRERVDDDLALPVAGQRIVGEQPLQLLVDEGRLGVLTVAEVLVGQ
jgi:hypothetical protein